MGTDSKEVVGAVEMVQEGRWRSSAVEVDEPAEMIEL